MAKATGQSPSQLLRISEWAARKLGMPYDWWTGYMLDAAVSLFGTWIENRLAEYDFNAKPSPRPKYKLKDLLSDAPMPTIPQQKMPGAPTSMSSIRRKKPRGK